MISRRPGLLIAFVVIASGTVPGESRPSVAVYLGYETSPSPLAAAAMQSEANQLFQPSGIALQWRSLADNNGAGEHANLFVVRLNGRCHMRDLQVLFSELGPYGEPMVLGSAHTVDRVILPFGQVECERIRRSIAQTAIGFRAEEREATLGRALGRVVAHELFHMMTGRAEHSRKGAFKATQTRHELAAPRFEFDKAELEELRDVARRLRPR